MTKATTISDAISNIGTRHIEEAANYSVKENARKPVWVKWGIMAACVCLVVAVTAALSNVIAPNSEPLNGSEPASASEPPDGGGVGCGTLPGGIRPELLADGTVFYWSGMSHVIPGRPETYLPEGYAEYGRISSVTESEATEDCQMKAGFAASGTIYTSKITPEAVYVLMTTDWFEDAYVRFTSSELSVCRIIWNGESYQFVPGYSEGIEVLKELPEGCELVGRLHYIGDDAIPVNDLETNYPQEGREVFYDSEDPDYIYVHERHSWREGEYDTYLKCPLWES